MAGLLDNHSSGRREVSIGAQVYEVACSPRRPVRHEGVAVDGKRERVKPSIQILDEDTVTKGEPEQDLGCPTEFALLAVERRPQPAADLQSVPARVAPGTPYTRPTGSSGLEPSEIACSRTAFTPVAVADIPAGSPPHPPIGPQRIELAYGARVRVVHQHRHGRDARLHGRLEPQHIVGDPTDALGSVHNPTYRWYQPPPDEVRPAPGHRTKCLQSRLEDLDLVEQVGVGQDGQPLRLGHGYP